MRLVRWYISALTGLFAFASHPVVAQRTGRTALGLKGGFCLSTLHAEGLNVKPVPGGTIGAYMPMYGSHRLEIQPEIAATILGATFLHHEEKVSTLRSLYIQMPLSAKLFVSHVLSLQGGVYGGMLMMAKSENGNGFEDVKESYQPFDYGLTAGLGLDLMSGLDITLRYTSGMTSILRFDNVIYPTNRSYQFTVGYRLFRFRSSFQQRRRRG